MIVRCLDLLFQCERRLWGDLPFFLLFRLSAEGEADTVVLPVVALVVRVLPGGRGRSSQTLFQCLLYFRNPFSVIIWLGLEMMCFVRGKISFA